jgi:hypothetical protein
MIRVVEGRAAIERASSKSHFDGDLPNELGKIIWYCS